MPTSTTKTKTKPKTKPTKRAVAASPIKVWRAKNPLRVWRKDEGYGMMDAAHALGCGVSSIQYWEYGTSEPDYERLSKVMGCSASNLKRRWSAWQAKSPVKRG